jgi:hypothetical protein
MVSCIDSEKSLKGKTAILVDVSGSMEASLSAKSDLSRMDAACALALLAQHVCEDVDIFTFSNHTRLIPNAPSGLELIDILKNSQPNHSTYLGNALLEVRKLYKEKIDRLIVITDEQSHDSVGSPTGVTSGANRGYMINVASNRNGIGYGSWVRLTGFSEQIINFIVEFEKANLS